MDKEEFAKKKKQVLEEQLTGIGKLRAKIVEWKPNNSEGVERLAESAAAAFDVERQVLIDLEKALDGEPLDPKPKN